MQGDFEPVKQVILDTKQKREKEVQVEEQKLGLKKEDDEEDGDKSENGDASDDEEEDAKDEEEINVTLLHCAILRSDDQQEVLEILVNNGVTIPAPILIDEVKFGRYIKVKRSVSLILSLLN